jgi:hypothetical protein
MLRARRRSNSEASSSEKSHIPASFYWRVAAMRIRRREAWRLLQAKLSSLSSNSAQLSHFHRRLPRMHSCRFSRLRSNFFAIQPSTFNPQTSTFQVFVKAPFFGSPPTTKALILHPLLLVSEVQDLIHQMGGPPEKTQSLRFCGRTLEKASCIRSQGVGAGADLTSLFRVTFETGGKPPPPDPPPHQSASAAGPSRELPAPVRVSQPREH